MKKIIRLVTINILVCFSLLSCIEFGSQLLLDCQHWIKSQRILAPITPDRRSHLPNYQGDSLRKQYFIDLINSRSTNRYHSHYEWKKGSFYSKTLNINADGIRATTPYFSTNASLPLAIFLGGSTMWGPGVADHHTIPSLFTKYHPHTYHSMNYGESGYNAFQSYSFLIKQGILTQQKIELIVSYDGVNNVDFITPGILMTGKESRIRKALEDRRILSSTRQLINQLTENQTRPYGSISTQNSATALLESWLLTKLYADYIGADYLCLLQPNIYVGEPDISNLIAFNESQYKEYKSQEKYSYYTDIRRLLQTERYRILLPHFYDLTHILDHQPNVYIDFCHLNSKGNEIIAKKIAEVVQERQTSNHLN